LKPKTSQKSGAEGQTIGKPTSGKKKNVQQRKRAIDATQLWHIALQPA